MMEYEFKPLTKKKGFTVLQNIFVVGYIIAIQVYSLSCRITYLVFSIIKKMFWKSQKVRSLKDNCRYFSSSFNLL